MLVSKYLEEDSGWVRLLFRNPTDILIQCGECDPVSLEERDETMLAFSLGELIQRELTSYSTINGDVAMEEDEVAKWKRTADILRRHSDMILSAISSTVTRETLEVMYPETFKAA